MMISIRLDPDTENGLRRQLRESHIPLSTFVRDAIQEKLARMPTPSSPYELGVELFGRESSGQTDLSLRRKDLVRERLHAKYRGR